SKMNGDFLSLRSNGTLFDNCLFNCCVLTNFFVCLVAVIIGKLAFTLLTRASFIRRNNILLFIWYDDDEAHVRYNTNYWYSCRDLGVIETMLLILGFIEFIFHLYAGGNSLFTFCLFIYLSYNIKVGQKQDADMFDCFKICFAAYSLPHILGCMLSVNLLLLLIAD
ncbi:hypothetical protein ACJX0J_013936, partial [Zea mays]